MSNEYRNNHVVPEFWQKHFSGGAPDTWSYDEYDGVVKRRSIAKTMMIRDTYTIDPTGVADVSTERVTLGKVDTAGAKAFKALIDGERSEKLRGELADFFAVAIYRQPKMLRRYREMLREFMLQLLEASRSLSLGDFINALILKGLPAFNFQLSDYQILKQIPASDLEAWIDYRLSRLESLNNEDPELPHTEQELLVCGLSSPAKRQ